MDKWAQKGILNSDHYDPDVLSGMVQSADSSRAFGTREIHLGESNPTTAQVKEAKRTIRQKLTNIRNFVRVHREPLKRGLVETAGIKFMRHCQLLTGDFLKTSPSLFPNFSVIVDYFLTVFRVKMQTRAQMT